MLWSAEEGNVGLLRPRKVHLYLHCSGVSSTGADVEVILEVQRPAYLMYRVKVIRILVEH